MPFTLDRDDTPSNLHDHSYYGSYFTDLGNRKKGEEVGLYGKFVIAPIKNTGFFVFGLGGFTWVEEIQLIQSNVNRRYYTVLYGIRNNQDLWTFGGALAISPCRGILQHRYNYDNRMGVTGSTGSPSKIKILEILWIFC